MPMLCIPGDQALDFFTRLLQIRMEEEFGNSTREELEAEIVRQFDENGVEEKDARVIWLRAKLAKMDANTP